MKAALFALLCVAQIAVPLWMVRNAETTLSDGAVYLFRTAPVDPADLFRGRYVRLGFADLIVSSSEDWEHGESVFAVLGRDDEGFARIVELVRDEPDGGDYLAVGVARNALGKVDVRLNNDRFYMEETLAPAAERAYARLRQKPAWAEIRVLDGHGVISDVFIDGTRLADIARNEPPPKPRPTTSPR